MIQLVTILLKCYTGGYNQIRRNVVRHALNLLSEEVFDKNALA